MQNTTKNRFLYVFLCFQKNKHWQSKGFLSCLIPFANYLANKAPKSENIHYNFGLFSRNLFPFNKNYFPYQNHTQFFHKNP